ncbi:uncharacterized protein LOC115877196 [Sitophilus oryzae]|uniref:Uncharacterized protein LOC115877196 n=1 Tax=Sitophilus oryzae TaxID=7048 RepID=A0A6J2XDJ6_SITOR|nr:uncharacterized protein LOC115877196 [Sitophilus oryzae]
MYRMCLVNPDQRSLQRILWRENPDSPIEIFELATITYGMSAAAFLAIRCLHHIGLECSEESPVISDVIKNHFYVDDFLSGGDSIDDAIFIANEVTRYLKKGCFELRKWISNSPEILAHIQFNEKLDIIDFGARENHKR